MMRREYYSVRTKKNPNSGRFDLISVKKLFYSLYMEFEEEGYFQESFGFECVDRGKVSGTMGSDIDAFFLKKLRKDNLWPISAKWMDYSEEDLFDVIELLFDCISHPLDGEFHNYADCGWHYTTFDKKKGQDKYRSKINEILVDYADGFELSRDGETLSLGEQGMQPLLEAELPLFDPENVEKRVNVAILKFRRYRSSLEDRKEAVRQLADVLEFLRPRLREVLHSKDESDLFNIANNFEIRHHNPSQKTQYDQSIWLSWMFYFYLATIHAAIRLIKRKAEVA